MTPRRQERRPGGRDRSHAAPASSSTSCSPISTSTIADIEMEQEGVGTFGARPQLAVRGNSVHDLAAIADGELAMIMDGGQISALIVEAIGLDVGEALALLISRRRAASSRRWCRSSASSAASPSQDGVMQTDALVLKTTDSTITGSGQIDLGEEQLALRAARPSPGRERAHREHAGAHRRHLQGTADRPRSRRSWPRRAWRRWRSASCCRWSARSCRSSSTAGGQGTATARRLIAQRRGRRSTRARTDSRPSRRRSDAAAVARERVVRHGVATPACAKNGRQRSGGIGMRWRHVVVVAGLAAGVGRRRGAGRRDRGLRGSWRGVELRSRRRRRRG